MKKFMMMAAVALMTAMGVNAQSAGEFDYYLHAGGSLSTLTNTDDAKMRPDFAAGAGVQYMVSNEFGLALEVNAYRLGAKDKDTDAKLKTTYVAVPLLAKYYVTEGVSLFAGPQVSFLTSAKMSDDDVDIKVKDYLNKVDFSIPVGVSYEPKIGNKRMLFDLRYNIGISKVNKDEKFSMDDEKEKDARNSAVVLTVGYFF